MEQNIKYEIIGREGKGGLLNVCDDTCISRGVSIDISGNVTIGHKCVICEDVLIITHKHDKCDYFDKERILTNDLIIENDVFIGSRAIILPGVNIIGKKSIIGAGSVVTKDVLPNSTIAGNPAKEIRYKKEEGSE